MYNWDDPINEALNKPEEVKPPLEIKEKIEDSSQSESAKQTDLHQGYTGMEDLEKGAGRIQVDDKAIINCSCLLYTSPSPRDRTRSRMPSSA